MKNGNCSKNNQLCAQGRNQKIANFVKTGYFKSLSFEGKKWWKTANLPERLAHVLQMEAQHKIKF